MVRANVSFITAPSLDSLVCGFVAVDDPGSNNSIHQRHCSCSGCPTCNRAKIPSIGDERATHWDQRAERLAASNKTRVFPAVCQYMKTASPRYVSIHSHSRMIAQRLLLIPLERTWYLATLKAAIFPCFHKVSERPLEHPVSFFHATPTAFWSVPSSSPRRRRFRILVSMSNFDSRDAYDGAHVSIMFDEVMSLTWIIDSWDSKTHPHKTLIIIFDILYTVGPVSLLLILLTAWLSRDVRRRPTWFMAVGSWVVISVANTLLIGHQTGSADQIPDGLCVVQAILIYASPVL